MPIKDRGKFLNYQREYNKKRKQGCRSLHPESARSGPHPAYKRPEQQGVTRSFTSQIQGCKPPEKTPTISKNTIKDTQVNASTKTATSAKLNNPKTAPIPGSDIARKLDFTQLKTKKPIQTVGAIDRFCSLEEIAEAVRKGNPISGEELARLRRVGAKI